MPPPDNLFLALLELELAAFGVATTLLMLVDKSGGSVFVGVEGGGGKGLNGDSLTGASGVADVATK